MADELEREAIAMAKQYGFVIRMNKPLREFLRRVGERLGWQEFHKHL